MNRRLHATMTPVVIAIMLLATASAALSQEISRPVLTRVEVTDARLVSSGGATSIVADIETLAYRAYVDHAVGRVRLMESARQRARGILAHHDANKDGAIDREEFHAIRGVPEQTGITTTATAPSYSVDVVKLSDEQLESLFSKLDIDGDGHLGDRELQRIDFTTGPSGFDRLHEPFELDVSLFVDWSDDPVASQTVAIDSQLQRGTVTFGPFRNQRRSGETWDRLLPGVYGISAILHRERQSHAVQDALWQDTAIKLDDGTLVFVRADASQLVAGLVITGCHPRFNNAGLRGWSDLVVAGYDPTLPDVPYSWVQQGSLWEAREALEYHLGSARAYAHFIDSCERALASGKEGRARYLAAKAELLLLSDLEAPRTPAGAVITEERATAEFERLVPLVRPLAEYVEWWLYHRKLELKQLREDIDALFLDIWKKAKLCTPDYEPTGTYSDGTARTLQSERNRWFRSPPAEEDGTGGGQRLYFLSCSDLLHKCRGFWDRELWLWWLGAEEQADHSWAFRIDGTAPLGSWMEQVVDVERRFAQLYGLKNGECESGKPLRDHDGGRMLRLDDDSATPCCAALLWPVEYRLARKAVRTLRRLAMSYANRLCKDHSTDGETVRFAFCRHDENGQPEFDTEHADGRVDDAVSYYAVLLNYPKAFYNALDLYALHPPTDIDGPFEIPIPWSDANGAWPSIPEPIPEMERDGGERR